MQTNGRKRTKADLRREELRVLKFPDVSTHQLWSNSLKGWCWVPRTMPLILHAIRSLSKGSSAAETYFALWCNCLSESVVDMNNKANLISSAGYGGATNERTWKERMKKLAELGFIKIASGKHGDISCVLILNPHIVLKQLRAAKTPGFDEKNYQCILENIADYGMLDFKEPVKSPAPPPPPPVPQSILNRPPPRRQIVPRTPVLVTPTGRTGLKRKSGK